MVWRHCTRARAPQSAEPPWAGSQTGECEQGGTPALFRLAKLARPCEAFVAGCAGSCKNQPGDFSAGGPLFSCASRRVGAPASNAAAKARRVHISISPISGLLCGFVLHNRHHPRSSANSGSRPDQVTCLAQHVIPAKSANLTWNNPWITRLKRVMIQKAHV